MNASKWTGYSSPAVLMALYVVGAVSNGSLRHEVQTLPLWIPVVLGFRRRELAKWFALRGLVFWLGIMVLIRLFLLGWSHIAKGGYSPLEVAMTLAIGVACVSGIGIASRWRTALRLSTALGLAVLSGALQLLAFRISLIPYIAHHQTAPAHAVSQPRESKTPLLPNAPAPRQLTFAAPPRSGSRRARPAIASASPTFAILERGNRHGADRGFGL